MSKIQEYISAASGYDSHGLPASLTQFTFGTMPFSMAETERLEDVMTVTKAFQTDAIVDINIVDNVLTASFDFSMDTQSLVEFFNELNFYREQTMHVAQSIAGYQQELETAIRNEDGDAIEDINIKLRSLSLPFMIPTIIPTEHGGTVNIGFEGDPKFIFYCSDALNQMPSKVVMIFEASQLFAQDEIAIYDMDAEDEIRMQQEEMFYMDEMRRAEEAAYQMQYSSYNQDYYDGPAASDGRLKGVRIK